MSENREIKNFPTISIAMSPFIPEGAERIATQLAFSLSDSGDAVSRHWNDSLAGRQLPKAAPIFPRIEVEEDAE